MSKGQIVTEGHNIYLVSEIRWLYDGCCRDFGVVAKVCLLNTNKIKGLYIFEALLDPGTTPALV